MVKINNTKIKNIPLLLVLLFVICSLCSVSAQTKNSELIWSHLDLDKDHIFGVSKLKADSLLNGKQIRPVIVAVIDGGADINHTSLKNCLWTNSGEIPNNNKDDDGNGYVDDIHGWNFLGSKKGSFLYDNTDMVRILREALKKDSKSNESIRLQIELEAKKNDVRKKFQDISKQREALASIIEKTDDLALTETYFRKYHYNSVAQRNVIISIVNAYKNKSDIFSFKLQLDSRYENYKDQLEFFYNENYNPRLDKQFTKFGYGNADVSGINPYHGTHVSGIIANKDVDGFCSGISSNAQIMVIRAVGRGEYFDRDIAMAIKYATDNGAKIINMSVGKSSTTDPLLLEEAIKYAMTKDVLIIHACGNESKKLHNVRVYPNKKYSKDGEAESWIEVGASGRKNDESLISAVSNYGREWVDVFAPGEEIYSTIPGNKYAYLTGTSMAAPLVSGIAAVLRGYYPNLNARQIKTLIMRSVTKVNHNVTTGSGEIIQFADVCLSGGIINLYRAIKLAELASKNYK